MNKQGQVLAAFLLLFPFLCLLLAYVIDLGMYEQQKQKVDFNVKAVIRYGFRTNSDSTTLKQLLEENIAVQTSSVDRKEGQIWISLETQIKTIFPRFWNHLNTVYQVSFHGSMEEDYVKIVKE